MALSSLSRSFLSRISISTPVATPTPINSVSELVKTAVEAPPLISDVGDNCRNSLEDERDSILLSDSFIPIKNMELYPQKSKVIEDGCIYEEIPFYLLSGENVEYMGRLAGDNDLLYLTNYRLLATQENGFYSVPLSIIETIEVQSTKETLNFLCRDCRVFRLTFSTSFKAKSFLTYIQSCLQPFLTDYRNIFAFIYHAYRKDIKLDKGDGVKMSREGDQSLISLKDSEVHRNDFTLEYRRMGMCSTGCPKSSGERLWRISQCNSKYEVCSTYPKLLIVPQSVTDEDIIQSSKFRMSGRLPVVVWRHSHNGRVIVRSSQPLVGVLSWRSNEDEKLLLAISEACGLISAGKKSPFLQNSGNTIPYKDVNFLEDSDNDSDGYVPQLIVMDLRSYTATLGNRAKGGGSECTDYYPNCDVQFKGLPNIHSVRKSYQQLRALLASGDQISFLSNLEACQWLSYLSQLLDVSCEVVSIVHDSALPILIHCSDGWDRTTQVVALAELMLDPYYRTIKGFRVLVEREWLHFGHKFGDRCGYTTDDNNQRCPVFMQWLDCVYQLTRQFPCDFQFNEHYLVKLGQHAYSCLFGTFLGNSMKEREDWRVKEDTTSIWTLLRVDNSDFINFLFQSSTRSKLKVLKPVTNVRNIHLWRGMYCIPSLSPYSTSSYSSSINTSCNGTLETSIKRYISNGKSCNDLNSSEGNNPENHSVIGTDEESDCDTHSVGPSTHITPKMLAFPNDPSLDVGKSLYVEDLDDNFCASPDVISESSNDNICNESVPSSCLEKCNAPVNELKTTPGSDLLCIPEKNDTKEQVLIPDAHESLHKHTKSDESGSIPIPIHESKTSAITSKFSRNYHSESFPILHSNPHECSDEHFSNTPQLHPPSSSIEMFQIYRDSSISSNFSDSKLNMGRNICQFNTGVDGLPVYEDSVQNRMKTLEAIHRSQIKELTKKMNQIKEKVAGLTSTNIDISQVQIAVDELDKALVESPSSLSSWDCVDSDNGGIRWIPDHAVTHCVGCGGEFWAARRKHHCRSCGNVFCGFCSNYFCQVPHEQLYDDVRVCEKCFYKLDGHLKQKSRGLT